MADFNYFLNRAGVRGLPGVKGDPGDSPIITVQTETPNEYILKITNPDGTELISPNLRGNKININEGTYVRYNTETGELYTSTADGATGELAGVVRLATDVDITDMDERTAVTPSQLADALSKYLVSPDGSVKIVQNAENSLTELTVEGGSSGDLPIASTTQLGGVKVDGTSIIADENGVISSVGGGGTGDVTAAGNNRFTGDNTFTGKVNIAGGALTVDGVANLNQATAQYLNAVNITSSGEINAVSIKANGLRSDDIQTTENKKYLTEVDVDSQTIQVVNGKLHANLDEVNREISDVSTRVTTLEGRVEGISITVDSNTTDIEDLKKTKNDNIFDIGKFTVVGNPTITDDGVASGFSNSNHLKVPFASNFNTFEIILPFNISQVTNETQILLSSTDKIEALNNTPSIRIAVTSGRKLWTSLASNGSFFANNVSSNKVLDYNVDYLLRFRFDGVQYLFDISSDNGKTYQNYIAISSTLKFSNISNLWLGFVKGSNGTYWQARYLDIDLKQFSITVDGEEVFSGLMNSTKPIYDKITTLNTNVSDFELETSNNFSAVNSALNEKANLSDVALKQNKLVQGDNITLTNNADGTTTISASGTISPTVELVDGGNASGT